MRSYGRAFSDFEAVLVETVEDLVVGETAYLQVLAGEALMQGLVNRYKGDGIVSVLEDMIEPLSAVSRCR